MKFYRPVGGLLSLSAMLITGLITGCSLFPRAPINAQVVSPSESVANLQIGTEKDFVLTAEGQKDGVLMLRKTTQPLEGLWFAQSSQACGLSNRHTLRGLSRQLLVGFQDIEIKISQVSPDQSRGIFLYTATTGESSVLLVDKAVRSDSCVNDTVLWRQFEDRAALDELSEEQLLALVRQLLPE